MKDLRWLAILVLMALLVACDVTRAAAPLAVNLPTAAPQTAHVPPAEVVVKPRLIPPGLRVEGSIPASVLDRFYALAYLYPDVAKRTTKIVARRAGGKGWAVSYEAKTIYINVDKGEYVLIDTLTQQFARRAFDHLRKYQPATAKTFRTWQRFAGVLARAVR